MEMKTPQEWAADEGMAIYDPDGWRMKDSPPFDEPCLKSEFDWRFSLCTIGPIRKDK